MRIYLLTALLLTGSLIACKKDPDPVAASATAQGYVDEVVGLMQAHSINRKAIDWTAFKQQVNTKAQGAQTIADTYPALQLALTLLGDNHSYYITAAGASLYGQKTIACTDGLPAPVPANAKIGYVLVGGFIGSGTAQTNFAQSVQASIKRADTDSVRGWVVDLRGNTGGNLWAMLAGIGPILGEGVAGYFIEPDGTTNAYAYQSGRALLNQSEVIKLATPYILRRPNPRVAVLTNRVTASSGEAIAIAFKGRADTRSFGTPTCGLSTVNADINLSDGALLVLTQGTLADRSKALYGLSVQPDDVAYSTTAVDKAVEWLLR